MDIYNIKSYYKVCPIKISKLHHGRSWKIKKGFSLRPKLKKRKMLFQEEEDKAVKKRPQHVVEV